MSRLMKSQAKGQKMSSRYSLSYARSNRKLNHVSSQRNGKRELGQSERGQIILEYVLLLAIAISLAILINSLLISRDPDEPGVVLRVWNEVLRQIGADSPDAPTGG